MFFLKKKIKYKCSAAPHYMSSTTSVGSSIHPSRAHHFYGGLTFAGNSSASLPSLYSSANGRHGKHGAQHDARRESRFSQQRRGKKRTSALCIESVVDSLESVKSEWRCVYCNLAVEIDNKTNQVQCPQCHSKHLEAPRRPTQGLLPAR